MSLKWFREWPMLPISIPQQVNRDNNVSKCLDAAPSFKSVTATLNKFFETCFRRHSALIWRLYSPMAFLWVTEPLPIKQRWSMHVFFILYQFWFFPLMKERVLSFLRRIPVASVPLEEVWFRQRWARSGVNLSKCGFAVACSLKA